MELQKPIQSYLNQVINKYVYYFDVYRNEKLGSFPLSFMALYNRRDEKYLMTKTIKIWGVENQQCIFVSTSEEAVTMDLVQQFILSIQQNLSEYIPDKQDHMSTAILGVIVTNHSVDEEVVKGVSKYRKLKFFKFGWHGWAEMYMAIISLKDESAYIHPKGRTFIEPFTKAFNKKEELT